jgi:transcriptional regulator with XRE-family HTH domain
MSDNYKIININKFIAKSQELRKRRNISARKLSRSISMSQNYIAKLEKENRFPSLDLFLKMCDVLRIDPGEYLDGIYESGWSLRSLNEKISDPYEYDIHSNAHHEKNTPGSGNMEHSFRGSFIQNKDEAYDFSDNLTMTSFIFQVRELPEEDFAILSKLVLLLHDAKRSGRMAGLDIIAADASDNIEADAHQEIISKLTKLIKLYNFLDF